jgi:hypothetical protein
MAAFPGIEAAIAARLRKRNDRQATCGLQFGYGCTLRKNPQVCDTNASIEQVAQRGRSA